MEDLFLNLQDLVLALWGLLTSVIWLLLPWLPLAAWVAFWMFAVNWVKLRAIMVQGGWIGILLIGIVMILIWGVVAPPADGFHYMLGLKLSNFVGKTVYVTALFVIMFLCGSVQLTGCCASCCHFEEEAAAPAESHEHGH
jgi:hypothetical protein